MVQEVGGELTLRAGENTGEAERRSFSLAVLRLGFCAMFIIAVMVSVGYAVPAAFGER